MLLDFLLFLVVATLLSILFVWILHFLVSRNFFLPFFLKIIKRLGGSTGRITTILCFITEIATVILITWGCYLLLNSANINSLPKNSVAYAIMETIQHLSWVSLIIFTVLLLQTLYMFTIGILRWQTYYKAKQQSRQYAPKVAKALKDSNISAAISIGDEHKESYVAMVVSSGLKEFQTHRVNANTSIYEMEALRRDFERAIDTKTAELKNGLSGLGTISSTAPYIGLIGTVIGLIAAFLVLRNNETANMATVGGVIAEALVSTAFGIAVAVPAMWLFNYFTNRIENSAEEGKRIVSEFFEKEVKARRPR